MGRLIVTISGSIRVVLTVSMFWSLLDGNKELVSIAFILMCRKTNEIQRGSYYLGGSRIEGLIRNLNDHGDEGTDC